MDQPTQPGGPDSPHLTTKCLNRLDTFRYDVGEVIEAHLLKLRRPAPRAIFDHFYRHVDVDAVALWRTDASYMDRPLNIVDATEPYTRAVQTQQYVDTHCWVFYDQELLELCQEVAGLDWSTWPRSRSARPRWTTTSSS